MRGMPGTFAAAIVAATLAALPAVAVAEEGPTRAEYVAMVEPICESNTEANSRILKGVRAKVRNGKLPAAGGQFIRASDAFGKTVVRITEVPRPPADDARLNKWFGFLGIVKTNLRKVGTALKAGNRVKANHEVVRTERSANAANNVGSIFPFRFCKLTPSRFSG
jgi:hypothetical protein